MASVFLFSVIIFYSPVFAASWASIPLTGPSDVSYGENAFSYAPFRIGGQVINMVVSLSGLNVWVNSYSCPFCPGNPLYDEERSLTKGADVGAFNNISSQISGRFSTERIELANGISVDNSSIAIIDQWNTDFSPKILGGVFSLAVDAPTNHLSGPKGGPIYKGLIRELYDSGQLLNPVVGLRLGGDNDGKIDMGFIDPNAFEGNINWIQPVEPQESWDLPLGIQIDEYTGANGTAINGSQNIVTTLDSFTSKNIYLPNAMFTAFINQTRPGATFIDVQSDTTTVLPCDTRGMGFSAVINGVDYPMDIPTLMRPVYPPGSNNCTVAIMRSSNTNLTATATDPVSTLGIMWLRNVYMIYRFPTDNCSGYIGLARASNRTRLPAQRSTNPHSSPSQNIMQQCLTFQKPSGQGSATNLVTTAPPRGYVNAPKGYTNMNYLKTLNGNSTNQPVAHVEELVAHGPRLRALNNNTSGSSSLWDIFG